MYINRPKPVTSQSLLLHTLNELTRLTKLGDLNGISVLYRELRPNDPEIAGSASRTLLSELISNSNIRLDVQHEGDVLVSTCMLAIVPNLAHGGQAFGIIAHVITLNAHQRRGYSRMVLQKTLALAWTSSCYKVMLRSGVDRSGTYGLYAGLGFSWRHRAWFCY